MTSAEVEAIINNTDGTILLSYSGNLYEYIGSEYGKDKTDLEIVVESYEKAKKKGYMGAISNPLRQYYNRGDNDSNGIRGRGGGRGGRGGRNPQGIWMRGH